MLPDVNSASLEYTLAHFNVEGKVMEARVPCKLAIFVPHQVLEVISTVTVRSRRARKSPLSVGSKVGKAHEI